MSVGGCSRTYLTHGGRSPDGQTEMVLTCHGGVWRAYMDTSRKLVDVWIGPLDNSRTLFSHRYKYTGADIYWHISWSSLDAVGVDLYDYGGVLASEGAKVGAASNHIAKLEFYKDKQTGKFIEREP